MDSKANTSKVRAEPADQRKSAATEDENASTGPRFKIGTVKGRALAQQGGISDNSPDKPRYQPEYSVQELDGDAFVSQGFLGQEGMSDMQKQHNSRIVQTINTSPGVEEAHRKTQNNATVVRTALKPKCTDQ